MSSPVVILVLEGGSAVQKSRELIGATNPKKALRWIIRSICAESVEKNYSWIRFFG